MGKTRDKMIQDLQLRRYASSTCKSRAGVGTIVSFCLPAQVSCSPGQLGSTVESMDRAWEARAR